MAMASKLDLSLFPNKKFGVGIMVLLVELFLWINRELVFGSKAAEANEVLLTYIVMQTAVLAVTGKNPEVLNASFDRMVNFLLIFMVTAGLLVSAGFFFDLVVTGWGLAVGSTTSFIILHATAVAYTEELVFRGVLAQYTGDLIGSAVFAIFHAAVYNASPLMILTAGVLGLIFAWVRQFFGIMGSWGAHTAWNLKAGGILDALIRGSTGA